METKEEHFSFYKLNFVSSINFKHSIESVFVETLNPIMKQKT